MEEWKEYKLLDIAEVQTGPFGSQLHNEDYVTVGTPIVTVEHLGNRQFSKQNLPLVSNDDRKRLSKYSLQEGDIVFSRVGSVDRCSYVTESENGWFFLVGVYELDVEITAILYSYIIIFAKNLLNNI